MSIPKLEIRPYVVEIIGAPNSGKTTLADILKNYLEMLGFSVSSGNKIPEIETNIPKKSWDENIFKCFLKNARGISSSYEDTDFVILDGGFYDSQLWNEIYEAEVIKESSLEKLFYSNEVNRCLKIFNKLAKMSPNLLIGLDVSIDESIKRNGRESFFSNPDFLIEYKKHFKRFFDNFLANDCHCEVFNTTHTLLEEVAEKIIDYILEESGDFKCV